MTRSAERIVERLKKSRLDTVRDILNEMDAEIERIYPSERYRELMDQDNDWSNE